MEFINKSKIEKDIKELPKGILTILLDTATYLNIKNIAIVGGIVRDIITKSKHKGYTIIFNDLDIVIEGDVIKFVEKLKIILGPKRINVIRNNINYKTCETNIDGIKVDIASAREENYPVPGENPTVKSTKIEQDLIRRDFNINAMAINLRDDKLIDLFAGLDGISNKQIDFLHEFSVLEDPTRIIRASRYSAKLNFKISNKSLKQIQSTIISWPWSWHPHDKSNLAPSALSIRLRMELELLLKSKEWEKALINLKEWGALEIIDSELQNNESVCKTIKKAKESNIDCLTAFIYLSKYPLELSERFQLAQQQLEIIKGAILLKKYLKKIESTKEYKDWSPSKWTTSLENLNAHEHSFLLEICTNNPLKKYLSIWVYNWKNIVSPISGNDLINQGLEPGPQIGKEIRKQRMRLIDEQSNKQ